MSKFGTFMENLIAKPLFWGVAGTAFLGGAAYVLTRDEDNQTIIKKDDNQTTGSTDGGSTTTTTIPTVVTPPVVTANPETVKNGIPVTLSTNVNGAITWYKNGASLNLNQASIYIENPTEGDKYSARLTLNNVTSSDSNLITVLANGIVIITPTAPTITSNPSTVYAGTSVTFSAVASGIITWYLNGNSLNQTGSSLTVASPQVNAVYTARVSGSGDSNSITVQSVIINGNVQITEPNKPQYFFSDSKNAAFIY